MNTIPPQPDQRQAEAEQQAWREDWQRQQREKQWQWMLWRRLNLTPIERTPR